VVDEDGKPMGGPTVSVRDAQRRAGARQVGTFTLADHGPGVSERISQKSVHIA